MSTTNFWPTPQDYNEAVQNPHTCFADPDLKNGTIETNMLGLPRAMTGAFASVYKLTHNGKSWAVRCFLTSRLDQKDRYKHISDFVLFDSLDCTIDFHYVEKGIQVKGVWYPCLKMPWVEGQTLDQYVNKNFKDSSAMKKLLEDFHKMVDEMECAGIGHGDLQHGNVIVTNEGLRLVDYDALFVPALLGRTSLELGHPNYQHPDRNEYFYDPDVDNFSCWLISKSLLIIAIDPTVYENHLGGDDCLLFKRTDLAKPEESQLFRILLEHSSEVIRDSASLIMRMLWAAPTAIPILDCPPELLQLLPTFRNEIRDEDPASTIPLNPQPITNSARNRFDFIEGEAVTVAKDTRKKSNRTAKQQIEQLNKRRQKVVEDIHLFFSPYTWIRHHLNIALSQFETGNYDGALNTYLRVYKLLEKNNWKKDENFFWCIMGMGYCSALSDRMPLAGNYFLLASKTATSETRALRAALCLAVIRFESGDVAAAHKLIKDYWKGGAEFGKAVEQELKNMFLQRSSTFDMLASLGISMQQASESRWSDALAYAKIVLDQVSNRTPIAMTQQHAEAMLGLADLYLKNSDFGRALTVYQEVGRNAITSGIKTVGYKAVFCACCLHTNLLTGTSALKHQRQAYNYPDLEASKVDHARNMNIVADCVESDKDVFKVLLSEMTSKTISYVPRAFVREVVFELGLILKQRKRPRAAAECFSSAIQFSVENSLDLSSRLFDQLGAFSDDEIWNCLSETFFAPNRLRADLLTAFLIERRDARLLTLAAQRLASEEKLMPLSLVFSQVAMEAPLQFKASFAGLDSGASDFDAAQSISASISQALRLAADGIDRELSQALLRHNSKQPSPEILKKLDALNVIRDFLHNDGQIALMMMRDEVAPHLLEWMRGQDMNYLSSFVRAFVEYSSIDDLKLFILNLANSDRIDDLESVVLSLRAWGMEPETLVSLLLPAAKESSSKLNELLDKCGVDKNGKTTGLVMRNAEPHMRALLRIRTIAEEAHIGADFEALIHSMYTHDRISKMAIVLLDTELKNDTTLLSEVAMAMSQFDNASLEPVLLRMAANLPPESILSVANKLLASNQAPHVVSLSQKLSRIPERIDTFRLLSFHLMKELPETELIAFADSILAGDSQDASAVVCQHLKALARTEILRKVVNKNAPVGTHSVKMEVPSPATIASIVQIGDTVSGAAIIHIATMTNEKQLIRVLGDFETAGITPSARQILLQDAVELCDRALATYLATIASKPTSRVNLDVLATLNMAALYRLLPFCTGKGRENAASRVLNNPDYADFATLWLEDLSEKNELAQIAAVCTESARNGNGKLLTSFFLKLGKGRNLRPLIAASKRLCDSGLASHLVTLSEKLLNEKLQHAFGAVSLEIVTSSFVDRETLLELLKTAKALDHDALRIVLRQIGFYRGEKELKAVARLWSDAVGGELLLEQSRAMGLIT